MRQDPAYEAVKRARNQVDGGNPQGAADTLEAYLATDPHNVYARMELAQILVYSLKNRESGLFQLGIVLDLDPDNTDALKAAATVKSSDRSREAEADGDYRHLVALLELDLERNREEYAAVCAAYAVFLRKQRKDYARAEEYYEKAVAMDPNRYEYHQDYAVFLLNECRDYVKARHELEEVLRIKPGHIEAKKNLDRLVATKFDAQGNVKYSFLEKMAMRRSKR